MSLLRELKKEYKTISIVGMAKNAGKTTALNFLIEEAMDEGMVLGITSTGRDGESTDLVTGTEKPKVFLDVDTLVSVPTQLYDLADAGLEILRMTKYSTTLGPIMLCRVAESGYVQIAGPVNTADHKKMCDEMRELGAELILIDGAIDRKSIAAPDTSDAIILSTGAVLSRSIRKVVEETAYIVAIYRLHRLEEGKIRDFIELHKEKNKITIMPVDGVENQGCSEPTILDLKTGLAASKFLDEAMKDCEQYVYIPGAFTKSVIGDISPKKIKNTTFVLKDPTKIFIDSMSWHQLTKRGLKVQVLESIKVAALTVNPYAPTGYSFEHKELLEAMEKAIKDIPIVDVRM